MTKYNRRSLEKWCRESNGSWEGDLASVTHQELYRCTLPSGKVIEDFRGVANTSEGNFHQVTVHESVEKANTDRHWSGGYLSAATGDRQWFGDSLDIEIDHNNGKIKFPRGQTKKGRATYPEGTIDRNGNISANKSWTKYQKKPLPY